MTLYYLGILHAKDGAKNSSKQMTDQNAVRSRWNMKLALLNMS